MPLPETSLSTLCTAIREFVRTGVNAAANNIDVSMGPPAEAADAADKHGINLFFYRFEPGGFDANSHPNDPWRIRMHCLISVFGIQEDDIPPGENDLRLLGDVLRLFHESPVMDTVSIDGDPVRLQVVFNPLTDENINQIWSTQGDATYHPSVVYEMALAPIMPETPRIPPPRVGAVGGEARADRAGRFAAFTGVPLPPPVQPKTIDPADPAWAPAVCWIHNGECFGTLSFDETALPPGFTLGLWLAGDPSETVDLVWEIWDSAGWRPAGPPIPATPFSTTLNPDEIPAPIPGTFPIDLSPPMAIPAGETAAQGLLYAVRSVVLVPDGPPTEIRSNPLLVSLYRTGGP
jgi:hypothetical protein